MRSWLWRHKTRPILRVPAGDPLTVDAPEPTSVDGDSGAAAGGESVTIRGTGFELGCEVTFGATAATNVVAVQATRITCTVPAHAAGVVDITVTNPDDQAGTLENAYTFVAAPAPTSVSPATGSIDGGESVTITGTGFQDGATVTFGGAAATSVVVVGPTSITCTTPAGAEGLVDVVVTNPDAQAGTLNDGFTYEDNAFDPAVLALSGWWRADYAGAPWTGTASAGASGSRSLVTAGNDPAVGSAVGGLDPADFDGSNDLLASTVQTSDLFSAGAGSFWCLFYADTAPAPGGADYDNGNFLTNDTTAEIDIGFTSAGFSANVYGGAHTRIDVACSTGAWHLGQVRWDGANLEVRVDGGSWSSVAFGGWVPVVPEIIKVGRGYSGAPWFDGRIAEMATAASALSTGDFDNVRAYCADRYGVSV